MEIGFFLSAIFFSLSLLTHQNKSQGSYFEGAIEFAERQREREELIKVALKEGGREERV